VNRVKKRENLKVSLINEFYRNKNYFVREEIWHMVNYRVSDFTPTKKEDRA